MLDIQIRPGRAGTRSELFLPQFRNYMNSVWQRYGSSTTRWPSLKRWFSGKNKLTFHKNLKINSQSRLGRCWRRPEHSKLLFIQVYRPRPTCFPFMFGPRPAKDTDSRFPIFSPLAKYFGNHSNRLSIEVGVVLHTPRTVQTIIYTSVYTHTNLFSIHVRSPARQWHSTDK